MPYYTTPAEDDAQREIYNKIIQAFGDCVLELEQAGRVDSSDKQGVEDTQEDNRVEDWEILEMDAPRKIVDDPQVPDGISEFVE